MIKKKFECHFVKVEKVHMRRSIRFGAIAFYLRHRVPLGAKLGRN